jgi:hypothetical protein
MPVKAFWAYNKSAFYTGKTAFHFRNRRVAVSEAKILYHLDPEALDIIVFQGGDDGRCYRNMYKIPGGRSSIFEPFVLELKHCMIYSKCYVASALTPEYIRPLASVHGRYTRTGAMGVGKEIWPFRSLCGANY